MCSLSDLNRDFLITKVCFHIVMVDNAAPGFMEAVSERLSFGIIVGVDGFHEAWKQFVMLFPYS